MKRCKLSDLDSLFALISNKRELYLPVDGTDGRAHYSAWHEGVELSQKTNTVCSAKDFFFPQSEDLVEFRLSGNSISVLDIRTERTILCCSVCVPAMSGALRYSIGYSCANPLTASMLHAVNMRLS